MTEPLPSASDHTSVAAAISGAAATHQKKFHVDKHHSGNLATAQQPGGASNTPPQLHLNLYVVIFSVHTYTPAIMCPHLCLTLNSCNGVLLQQTAVGT